MNRPLRAAAAWLAPVLLVAACAGPGPREAVPPPEGLEVSGELAVTRLWSRDIGRGGLPADRLQPTRLGPYLMAASASGRVLALEPDTGRTVWRVDTDRSLSAGPSAGGGLLAVGTRKGEVVALSASDGSILWSSGLTSEVLTPPAIDQGLVVARSNDGRVFGLDAASGERNWIYDRNVPSLSVRGYSQPVLVPGGAIVGFDNGRLEALDLRDGTVIWEATVAVPTGRSELERMVDIDADPLVEGADVFAASYQGRLVSVSLRNGRINWARELSVHAGLAADSSYVFAADAEGRLWCLDRFSGASVWRQDALEGIELTAPAIQGDHVVVGSSDGHLNWLAVEDGRLVQRVRVGGERISGAPVVDRDRVYVMSLDGRVAAWRVGDGGS